MNRLLKAVGALGAAGISLILTGCGDADVAEAADRVTIRMAPAIGWEPDAPTQGHLFTIQVQPSEHTPLLGVHGRFGSEELHFRRLDGRQYQSLAAMPIGTEGSAEGAVRVVYADGGEETLPFSIPVTVGDYIHERLTVAPRFGAPPNAEDQARLARDRDRAAVVAAVAHRTPPVDMSELLMPRPNVVTSGFGDGRVFNGQVSSRHMGLDLRGFYGDTVWAPMRGVVALSEEFLLAGNLVYLNHGAGLVTGYFHLSDQLVEVGDTVDAGTPIGLVGATGRVTGPHLHWVVRIGRTSVDPRSLMALGAEVLGGASDDAPEETAAEPDRPPASSESGS